MFAKLKDINKDSLGAKPVTAAQLGRIDVFSDNGVQQILEVLDERYKDTAGKKNENLGESLAKINLP